MSIRHINPYGYIEQLDNPLEDCDCDGCAAAREAEGSTLYDRRARTDHEPAGARGEANLRDGTGHSSQWYDDGYRVSRDTDGRGDSRIHWTNDNVPKGKRNYGERHTPPPDARY